MTKVNDCPDTFHQGGPGEAYEVGFDGGMTCIGYRCPTCGFQTLTIESYIPTTKNCPRCGTRFEGMPDEPTHVCTECFRLWLQSPEFLNQTGGPMDMAPPNDK